MAGSVTSAFFFKNKNHMRFFCISADYTSMRLLSQREGTAVHMIGIRTIW